MGGRGSVSGVTAKDNIIQFPTSKTGTSSGGKKWDYRGYVQAVDDIEKAVNSVKSHKQAGELYSSIDRQYKSIDKEINSSKPEGDIRILMKQRWRLKQAKKALLGKGILG